MGQRARGVFTRIRGTSLGVHLAALLVLQVMVVLGVGGWSFASHLADARESALERAGTLAEVAARDIGTAVDLAQTQLLGQAQLAAWRDVLAAPATCVLTAPSFGVFPQGQIDVVRPDGAIVCSSRVPSGGVEGPGYAGASWLEAATEAASSHGPVRDPVSGRWSLVTAVPLAQASGAIVTVLDLEALGQALASRFHTGDEIVVVGEGRVAARSIDPARWTGDDLRRTSFRPGGGTDAPDVEGEARLYRRTPVDGLGWTVYAGVPRSLVRADIVEHLADSGLILAAGLVVVLVASVVVRTRLGRPIVELTRVMERTSEGAVGEAPVPAGPAELAELTEAFNRMQAVRRDAEAALAGALEREREAGVRLRGLSELKDRFLAAVSHELRTPLTSIVGFAATLETRRADLPPDMVADITRRLHAQALRLDDLLRDLLDLNALSRGVLPVDRTRTELSRLVRRIVVQVELGDHPLALHLTPVEVEVDASKVERAVTNLVDNAVKHTPPGTPISVRVARDGHGAILTVEDEGPGVPDGLKLAVFEPFRHGGELSHQPGTGIGLSLVSLIAELHGGRAWVDDRPCGGASFKVLLPAA